MTPILFNDMLRNDPATFIHKPEDTDPVGVDNPLRDLRNFMETRKGSKLTESEIQGEFDSVKNAADSVADEMREKLYGK